MKTLPKFLVRMLVLLSLALAVPAPAATFTNVAVTAASNWKFWKGTSEASTVPDTKAWRSNSFSDAGWTLAPAPFWYGDVLAGGTQITDMQNLYTSIFLRQQFSVASPSDVTALLLTTLCDDGYIAWINGQEVHRYNMPEGEPTIATIAAGAPIDLPPFVPYDLLTPAPASYLVTGNNTLAIQVFNYLVGSSDLGFDASLTVIASERTPPTIATVSPAGGSALNALTSITVEFSEPVTGINAIDLVVNGQFASSVTGSGTTYIFTLLPPAYGAVNVTWDPGHGISDLALPPNLFDPMGPGATWQYTLTDITAPTLATAVPQPNSTVASLSSIEVLFSEPVSGVNAGDLLINGIAVASMSVVTPSQYLFQFTQPNTGTVTVAWMVGHGIQDLAAVPNAFTGSGWSYILDTNVATQVVISEFVAENDNGILDEDGDDSDWIEIYNAGVSTVYLGNWFLTDSANNLDKWRFPNTNLPPNGYMLIWASEKNRRVAGAPLHTNFKIDAGGEYLALVRSNLVGGLEVISEYNVKFPGQQPNFSYGVAMSVGPDNNLVPTGASAKVLVPSSDLGLAWTLPGFGDGAWLAATTGIGFDTGTNYDPGIATDIQGQMLNINGSAFIRIPFNVADPASIQDLRLRMRYDDGFIAYLNGVEALRRNAPAAATWNSTATAFHGSETGVGGQLVANFDALNPAMTLTAYSAVPAPSVQAANAGSTGNFLRLLTDAVNNNINGAAFTQTAPGLYQLITADFDFRITDTAGNPADGFAMMLIPTATYGTSGAGYATLGGIEEPNVPNTFSIGFDLYPHGEPRNDISVHWNGAERMNTTIPRATIELVSGNFHRCSMSLRHADSGAYVTVIITPNVNTTPGAPYTAINNLYIPGLNPYDSRVQFGGRTGGADMSVDLDNINVQFGFPSGMVAEEEFNISPALTSQVGGVDVPTLVPGANVLAIHGLNRYATNADFLITPQLIGRGTVLQPGVQNFYSSSTPSAANESGAAGAAGAVTFSIPGGVYTNASLSLALNTTTPGATIRYTTDGNEPTASSTAYFAPIAIANSTVVKARAFANSSIPGPIAAHTYTMLDANMFTFNSKLPLVVIDTFGVGIGAENKVPCSMVFIDTFRGRASITGTPDANVRAGIELRGSSSLGFPKNSMGFETRDDNTNDFPVSLLGMPAESDWVLYAPYTDKTLMNDFVTYELWDAMGHYGVRHKFVEVFRDTTGGRLNYANDYWGVYILLEKIKIDDNRVDIPSLNGGDNTEPDVTGGYIFKRDRFDGNEHTFNVPINGSGGTSILGVEDPKGSQITQAQKNYLSSWFGQMGTALYGASYTNPVTGYAAYINVDSFIDHYWLVEMPKNIDGYRLSNFYHKDRNGKLKEGPVWDWNLSFGNANYLKGGQTNAFYWPDTGDADYLWYRRLFSDVDFNQKHTDRWHQLRTNVYATSNVIGRIATITNLLSEAVAREFVKWPRLGTYIWPNPNGAGANGDGLVWHVDFQTPTTYAGIISNMQFWTIGRLAWIDGQFTNKPPTFNLPEGPLPTGTALTISGHPGTTVYYTLDGTDPRGIGGILAPGARTNNAGPITISNNVRVVARSRASNTNLLWSGPTAATYVIETPPLLVTEIMYHPDPAPLGSTNNDEDFEYIEIKNHGPTAINLQGARLRGGVDADLPNYLLHPGCYVVVVAQTNGFRARYGNIPAIVGSYSGHLDNAGGHIVFEGPVREPIHDFDYSDGWQEITDGYGFSLVPVNESTPLASWGNSASWRASAALGGSPGTNDSAQPAIPQVVINEALTHAPTVNRAVELRNLSGSTADIGDWYLTDDFNEPRKYRFPAPTTILAGGHLTVPETAFNTGGNAFTLDALGDGLWLFSGDAAGNLTGYQHGFDFGAQRSGVTFGRHVTSQGDDHFVAQASATLGSANTGPLVGPITITEVNYHPLDVVNADGGWDNTEDEYIELRNITGSPVELHNPTNNAMVWKLRDAVDYSFPPGTSVPAGAYVLVVSFDPANTAALNAFKANNGVPNGLSIYGPWSGKLDNSSDSVELVRPDEPVPGDVPYVVADKVRYSHDLPWPGEADGFGLSLQRINESAYGNDVVNWAVGKSPGSAYVPGTPPEITQQPQNQSTLAGMMTAAFSVTATGTPPLSYQWFFNNTIMAGQTGSMLVLPNATAAQAGQYRCLVQSANGVKFSSNATLTVTPPGTQPPGYETGGIGAPHITAHPQDRTLLSALTATFSVNASGTPPFSYQWLFGGGIIASATNAMLILENIQPAQAGQYRCAVANGSGYAISSNATLTVTIPPSISQQPTNVFFRMPPDSGATPTNRAIFRVTASTANPPLTYRWRVNGTNVPANDPNITGVTSNILTLTNLTMPNAGWYSCAVTDGNGTIYSTDAALGVIPYLLHISSPVTVAAGADISVNAVIQAFPPPFLFSWRKSSTINTNLVSGNMTNFATFNSTANGYTNTTGSLTNTYNLRLVFTNLATTAGGIAPLNNGAFVTVVADTDGDGIPDGVETALGLNPASALDGALDPDGDGMSNAKEYLAGTDPTDPASYLKIQQNIIPGTASVNFAAVSNRTYTVQFTDVLPSAAWSRLADVLTRTTNRVEVFIDPTWNSNRFYRVVTPRQ